MAGPAENCRRVSVRPGEPAWMLAQGALCRDATSRPARSPGGINGGDRGAAIFPPGAGIVKGVAENALYTFTGIGVSEKRCT